MSFKIDAKFYVDYLDEYYKLLQEEREYITELDLATGDGDHWTNMNMGFEKILQSKDKLKNLSPSDLFKNLGMTMMSTIGGSSGILYGGAYLAASKELAGVETIGRVELAKIWEAMLEDMMKRGKSDRGSKTMIDALAPAVDEIKRQIEIDASDKELLESVAKAAMAGAESTREMPALRGRASYQGNKGVGHLDPGAVTMAYQIKILCEFIQLYTKDKEEQ